MMRQFLNRAFRDPVFHLVVIGGLLFWADGVFNAAGDRSHVIEISEARLAWLKNASEKATGHPPTDEMLPHLIDSYVQEEVLYREALALDMQRDDLIVRRRLAQKMRFFVDSVAHSSAPDDEELRSFYDERRELFRKPERFSFSHHYFSSDRRGNAREDAAEALVELQGMVAKSGGGSGSDRGSSFAGDPFMLPYHFAGQASQEVSRHFGDEFAAGLSKLPIGEWSGPVRSAYGWHLVRLTQKHESVVLPYEAVADKVLTQWQEGERLKANKQALARLQEKYQVVISPELGS